MGKMLHRPFYVKYNEWTSYGAAGEKICATDRMLNDRLNSKFSFFTEVYNLVFITKPRSGKGGSVDLFYKTFPAVA